MLTFTKHETATCPDCGSSLVYGTKDEASGWKVYYECNDRCGWEQIAGWVKLSEIEHQDEVHEHARDLGEQWAGP